MKTLHPALQAHLDEGTTTLAWCWWITRADHGPKHSPGVITTEGRIRRLATKVTLLSPHLGVRDLLSKTP